MNMNIYLSKATEELLRSLSSDDVSMSGAVHYALWTTYGNYSEAQVKELKSRVKQLIAKDPTGYEEAKREIAIEKVKDYNQQHKQVMKETFSPMPKREDTQVRNPKTCKHGADPKFCKHAKPGKPCKEKP